MCAACAWNSTEQRKLLPSSSSTAPSSSSSASAWTGDEDWSISSILQCITIWGEEPCQLWTETVGLLFNSSIHSSSSSSSSSSLIHISFPRWCSCSLCPSSPAPVPSSPFEIASAELLLPERTLVVRASHALSLPRLAPDLEELFVQPFLGLLFSGSSDATAATATAPPAEWVRERELRVNLTAHAGLILQAQTA